MKKLLKTSKKMLAVFLAMMMMLSVAVVAFAANPCEEGKHEFGELRAHRDPNCTERGYDIFVCKICGALIEQNFVAPLGHDYDEKDGVKVAPTCTQFGGIIYTCQREECPERTIFEIDRNQPPIGHDYSKWEYVPYEDGYAKQRKCLNEGCGLVEYERTDEDVNVYYSVEFVNKYVVDTRFIAVDGTSLPKTYANKSLEKIYVLKGEDAVYPGARPIREKTVEFRKFDFIGWTTDADTHNTVETVADATKSINENTTLYAEYRGVPHDELDWNVDRYEVSFSKENGAPTTILQGVLHGDPAQYPFAEPTKEENAFFTYKFLGWTRGDNAYIFDARTTPIYSSGVLYERFEAIPKDFTVEFYDITGAKIAILPNVHYGEPLKWTPTKNNTSDFTVDYEDESYIYKFSDGWRLPNGVLVNPDKFTFSQNNISEDNVVKLTADYNRKAVQYIYKLIVMDIDGETPASKGYVQILNSAGQFAAGTKLDEDGVAIISLTYDTSYSLQITRNGNVKDCILVKEGTNIYLKDPKTGIPFYTTKLNADNYAELEITLELDNIKPGGDIGEHNCMCHGFLARPWITMLNIIYKLFGRRTVCCVDMYERHGDILAYTK